MLNLEQNGITDWDELAEFRVLKDFNRLIINKNLIKHITQKSGFNSLEVISIEDNPFLTGNQSINSTNLAKQLQDNSDKQRK